MQSKRKSEWKGLKQKSGLKASGLKRKSLGASTKPKLKSVSQLKKLADAAHSQEVRLRDSDKNGLATCITCGVKRPWKELQCGHFVSRRVNSLRYDEQNTNAQCYSCNVMRYGEQYAYARALDLKYGDGTADKLHAQRFSTHSFTRDELQKIIDEAKESINLYLTQP